MDSEFAELDQPQPMPAIRRRLRYSRNAQVSEGFEVDAIDQRDLKREDLEKEERMTSIQQSLMDLEAAFFEDYERELDTASRIGFESFMRYNPVVGQPLISADSSGSIVATWQRGRECLSMRFLDRFDCHYALVLEVEGGALERTWGQDRATIFLAGHSRAMRIAKQ